MFFPQNASPLVMQNCDKSARGKDWKPAGKTRIMI